MPFTSEESQANGLVLWVYGTIWPRVPARTPLRPPSQLWAATSVCANTSGSGGSMTGRDRASPCRSRSWTRTCFVPLLRWLLAWWKSVHRPGLGYRPDEYMVHGDRINSIVISVVYRSCSHPCCLAHSARQQARRMDIPALEESAWSEPLLQAVPQTMPVLVIVRSAAWSEAWEQALWDGIHLTVTGSTPYCCPTCRHPSAGASAGTRAGT